MALEANAQSAIAAIFLDQQSKSPAEGHRTIAPWLAKKVALVDALPPEG